MADADVSTVSQAEGGPLGENWVIHCWTLKSRQILSGRLNTLDFDACTTAGT